ncbi:MAG: hypothetical protein ABIJ23_01225 [Candidatus Magasanikbacteria bacterium]
MDKKLILLTITIISLVVVSGCGQKSLTEKQIEKAMEDQMGQDVNVDLDSGAVKIETADGVSLETGEDVSLPTDFPTDVYVVDGQVISVMKNVMGADYQVTIKTDKSVPEVKDLYEEKLVDDSWEIGQSFAMADVVMLSASKDDRTVSISVSDDEDSDGVLVIINIIEGLN